MKKISLVLSFLLFYFINFGQYQPFITDPVLDPAPYKFAGQTGTATFAVGNSGACALNRFNENPCQNNSCKLVIRIGLSDGSSEPESGQANAVVHPTADLSGTAVSWFNWVYDDFSSQWLGIQNQVIPSGAGDIIVVHLRHVVGSPMSNPNNGLIVNLEPLAFGNGAPTPSDWTSCSQRPLSGGNVEADDQFSEYTYLPLQLINFNAKYLGQNKSKLTWITKNEINTLEFNIERKINGEENWTTIGKKAAAGQSSNEQLYIYDDNIGSAGKVYYRIKQIDVNGSYTYTDIQSIIIKKNDRFSMEAYPNPVKGKLEIVFNSNTESNVRLEIYDILGRSVFNKGLQFRNGSNYLDLNMSEYTPGTYIVRVSSAEINESMTVVKVD
jgi:hypothetical protein